MTRKIKAKGVEEFIEKRLELNYVCSLVDNGKDQEQEQVGAVAHMPDLILSTRPTIESIIQGVKNTLGTFNLV